MEDLENDFIVISLSFEDDDHQREGACLRGAKEDPQRDTQPFSQYVLNDATVKKEEAGMKRRMGVDPNRRDVMDLLIPDKSESQ